MKKSYLLLLQSLPWLLCVFLLLALRCPTITQTPATNSSVAAGSKTELKDSDGNVLISFTASKSFSSAILSCSELSSGKTYSLYINDTLIKSFEITSTITSTGSQSAGGNVPGGSNVPGGDWGFNPGGFGGAGGRR